MPTSIRDSRYYRLFLFAALAGCVFGIYYLVYNYGSATIPYGDSVQYWAAARLMLTGSNPYSPDQVLQLRLQQGNLAEFPQGATSMMLYPPWSIPLILPFGLINYPFSRLLWLLFHITIIVFSANFTWKIYGGRRENKFLPYLVTILFAPTIFVLGIGHFTTLHLLGLVGFLLFIQKPNQNRANDITAGFFASFVLIKPQLLYLFLFALFIWVIARQRWFLLAGGFLFITTLSFISILFNPLIFSQYWNALMNYELGAWATPTIGMVLRIIFGIQKDWLQVVPPLIGLLWFIIHWRNSRYHWTWKKELPLIILISFVTSPYMWTYDMVVLLIPVIAVIEKVILIENKRISRSYIGFFIIVNILVVLLHFRYSDFWFFWFAPILLIWYLVGNKLTRDIIQIPNSRKTDFAKAAVD